jgi:predicted N-acyltransferase
MIPEPDLSSNISVSSRSSASAIPGEAWTRLCPAGHPFLNADFLSIVERHGAAAPESGWTARHLVASDESGAVVGLLPLYIKSHSHGDFIYDWSWAAAYRQLGRQYYPKLMSCLPHTPVAGTRLLVAEGPHSAAIRQALVEAAKALANRCAASSWHVALATEAEMDLLCNAGC